MRASTTPDYFFLGKKTHGHCGEIVEMLAGIFETIPSPNR
jgi:hypothetical protein